MESIEIWWVGNYDFDGKCSQAIDLSSNTNIKYFILKYYYLTVEGECFGSNLKLNKDVIRNITLMV